MAAEQLDEADAGSGAIALSQAFRRYVADLTQTEVSLMDVVTALGDRSLPVALIVFSLPNCLPAPPGIGSLFALPLLAVAWQMLRGYDGLRLPAFLAHRKISLRTLRWLADKGMRPLILVEKRCHPRLPAMVGARAERWLSVWILVLSVVVLFPGPLTNFLPAIGIVIIAVGLIERDGLVVLLGSLWGLVAAIVATAFTVALVGGLWLGVRELFLD